VVKDTGKTPGTDTIKPVNLPEPLRVEENGNGLPAAIRERHRQVITAIGDKWRIDDEWWRNESVSRLYFAVMLDSGQRMVIYKDLAHDCWYRQAY
jgi:hypothetical protein